MNTPSLSDFPEDLERLDEWKRRREDEQGRVKEALAKLPKDRTRADWEWIGYSAYGTASGCSCGGG